DALSLADIMLIPHFEPFPSTPEGAEIMRGSPLLGWIERMSARPSVQKTEMRKLMGAAAG
ncbi:MAG TPA: glutathione S-transferase domain-containing protein, partial [Pseudomonadales bacterium]|nr:glutathione S-transferase domain-containing protein [Pseudomonadales bacterium]